MKLGKVIGRVTLSVACPAFKGARWLIINPSDRKNIKALSEDMESTALSPGPSPVVYDDLGAGVGDIIGYVEGAEAAAPFENPTPVDAINTAIIDRVFTILLNHEKVISSRDISELIANGGDPSTLPANALYTPSAKDLLNTLKVEPAGTASTTKPDSASAAPQCPLTRQVSNIESFFNSPEINQLKKDICDIGRRLWERDYVDGNGGNISVRVAQNLVLCTPTMVSKGFLKPTDMCFVDLDGNQKAGLKKRTSEILMHLEMMKAQPKAISCVHAHPPHATAFAVARIQPPTCMIPEMEILVGEAPIADYSTPGSVEMGKSVAALVKQHNTVLMANHGVVTWGTGVEDAYWKMEIVDAYCRTIVFATQLGTQLKTISRDKVQDLLKIKKSLGIPDRRYELKECELCDNSEWHPGVVCGVPPQDKEATPSDLQAEELIKTITEMIVNKIKN